MTKKVDNNPREYFEYLVWVTIIDQKFKGISRWRAREIYLPHSTKLHYKTFLTKYIQTVKIRWFTSGLPTSDTERMQDNTQIPGIIGPNHQSQSCRKR